MLGFYFASKLSANRRADARRSLRKCCIVGVWVWDKEERRLEWVHRLRQLSKLRFYPSCTLSDRKARLQSVTGSQNHCCRPRKQSCHFVIWRALYENDSYIFNAAADKRGCARGLFIRISASSPSVAVFHTLQQCFICVDAFFYTRAVNIGIFPLRHAAEKTCGVRWTLLSPTLMPAHVWESKRGQHALKGSNLGWEGVMEER